MSSLAVEEVRKEVTIMDPAILDSKWRAIFEDFKV